ncbi:MAG: transcriptional repressor [Oscillospiraceae bacterium]|jgi:Fur family peroxide stress response transcriptional regulator|nr:Transcriptional repressor [Ruminococcaceae bacterium BL-4]
MERKQNYSRKREAILTALQRTKIHPTAEWVYQELKNEYPDLSLGTVYRNLRLFKEEGVIASVGVVDGQERYDGDVTPHSHFVCTNCGKVIDVNDEFVDPEADTMVARKCRVKVLSHSVCFNGICMECLEALKKAETGSK